MDGALVVAFWGVSVLFVITPGVDWAYAISSGLPPGGVLPAVSGMLLGHLTATVVVAAGVAAALAASDVAMTVLTLAGAGYLIWLGASALRRRVALHIDGEQVPTRATRMFAKGVGISLLNPKVFLLFLALLPQFTSAAAAWPVGVQMVVLGAVHVASCAVVYYAVGYGAATVLTKRPRAARLVTVASGVVMVGLGVGLVAARAVASVA